MPAGHPFRLFGPDHLLTLVLIAAVIFAVVRAVRRGSERRTRTLGWCVALLLVGYAAVTYTQKGLAGELSWDSALPLELCHWVMAACVLATLCRIRLAAEIAFFWGSTGTLLSALTPDIGQGFPSWEFILFFWSHGGILLAIAFVLARGFRPDRSSVLRMMLALNIYAAVVGMLDALFGWNYGYLCGKSANPTLLDYLGPWPWYLLTIEGIALASFYLLWRVSRLRSSRGLPG